MAGVGAAILSGSAMPALNWRGGDHTYAKSNCGLRWGCFGRDTGGTEIVRGMGSSTIADCLSQPQSHAGIFYGITGVCHQAANRILDPAGIKVIGCGGYATSVLAYGEYGIGRWLGRLQCYVNPQILTAGGQICRRIRNLSSSLDINHSVVSNYVFAQGAQRGGEVLDFSAIAEATLGHPLEERARAQLQVIQAELRGAQFELIRRLQCGEITPDQYLGNFNNVLRSAMEKCRDLLGDKLFRDIFGEAGLHPEGLVDKNAFTEQAATGVHRRVNFP
jgi:hypothetical protein